MGNYLLSLRVPPPTPEEDERNHPLYYDWSIPKYSPFRQPPSQANAATAAKDGEKQPGGSSAMSQAKAAAKTLAKAAANVKQSNPDEGQKTFASVTNDIGNKTLQPSATSAATKSSGNSGAKSARVGKTTEAVASVGQTGAIDSLHPRSAGRTAAKNATSKTAPPSNEPGQSTKSLLGSAANGKGTGKTISQAGKAIVPVNVTERLAAKTNESLKETKAGARVAGRGEPSAATATGAASKSLSKSTTEPEKGKKT